MPKVKIEIVALFPIPSSGLVIVTENNNLYKVLKILHFSDVLAITSKIKEIHKIAQYKKHLPYFRRCLCQADWMTLYGCPIRTL